MRAGRRAWVCVLLVVIAGPALAENQGFVSASGGGFELNGRPEYNTGE